MWLQSDHLPLWRFHSLPGVWVGDYVAWCVNNVASVPWGCALRTGDSGQRTLRLPSLRILRRSGEVLRGLVRRLPLLPFEPRARAWLSLSSPFLSESDLPAPDATPAASVHRWRYPLLHRWGAAPSQAGWSGSEDFQTQLCPEPAA